VAAALEYAGVVFGVVHADQRRRCTRVAASSQVKRRSVQSPSVAEVIATQPKRVEGTGCSLQPRHTQAVARCQGSGTARLDGGVLQAV